MIKLNSVFQTHMILQCGKPAFFAGTAAPLTTVTVELDGKKYETDTLEDGSFDIMLDPHPAGGPYLIRVISGEDSLNIRDVLFGDVWIAGGQSNMELKLDHCNAAEQLSVPDSYDRIRFFNACNKTAPEWMISDKASRKQMSGVAFYFASMIYENTGIPIGIIEANYGGTSISSWISREKLLQTKAGQSYIDSFEKEVEGVDEKSYLRDLQEFKDKAEAWERNTEKYRKEHSSADWTEVIKVFGIAPWPEPLYYTSPFCPGRLYETLIKPLRGLTVRGLLWYQGESDAWNYRNYPELMRNMTEEWRECFGDPTLPFLYVQLPMFRFSSVEESYDWANQRIAQEKALQMIPNAYMAVITDQGELDNIHPTAKKPVGERLALLALSHVYGKKAESEAPRLKSFRRISPDKVELIFSDTGGKLISKGPIKAIEVYCDGIEYHDAVLALEENRLTVTVAPDSREVEIRHAYANYCEISLFGVNGLPMRTFRQRI